MIKDAKELNRLENDFMVSEGLLPYDRAVKIFASLWDEGVQLGVIPFKEPLDGIDTDIRIAAILNSCSRRSSPG